MVGFINDGDFDAIELGIAFTHVVNQSTWARNNNFGTSTKSIALWSVTDTTEDSDDA
jgi:hypothetical protein